MTLMAESNPYFKVLKSVPAFASLAESDFERAYDCAVLRVLTKGECWCVAGAPVSDLAVVVSGRLAEDGAEPGGGSEYGSGDTLEALAFFAQAPASATIHALREATLLTFAFADLSRNPTLLSRLAWAAALTEAASGAIAAGEPRPAR